MVVDCKITFDDLYNGIFYAGQMLTGRVELTLDEVQTVQGLCLKICGYARVRWTERHSFYGKRQHKTVYSGKNEYLESINYLIGSDSSGSVTDIDPGVHTYNFSCQLPPMLPSSYEDDIGHILYLAKVTLERPWIKFDHAYKSEFKVVQPHDLNFESTMIRLPVKLEETTSFGCLCCATGPMKVIAKIPKSGYVPGQKICIQLEINNKSNVKITGTKYILEQIIHYHSQSPVMKFKEEKKTIAIERGDGVLKQQNKIIEQILLVPIFTPPTSLGYSVIDIKYLIRAVIKTSGTHQSIRIDIPITIGTIPLTETDDMQMVREQVQLLASTFQASNHPNVSSNTLMQMPLLTNSVPKTTSSLYFEFSQGFIDTKKDIE